MSDRTGLKNIGEIIANKIAKIKEQDPHMCNEAWLCWLMSKIGNVSQEMPHIRRYECGGEDGVPEGYEVVEIGEEYDGARIASAFAFKIGLALELLDVIAISSAWISTIINPDIRTALLEMFSEEGKEEKQ